MAQARDRAQDMAKGLGILLVVESHLFNYPSWYRLIMGITGVWLMAFFFILSGYYYHPGKRTPGESTKRRAQQLLKPFFRYSLTVWLLTTAYNLATASRSFADCLRDYRNFLLSRNGQSLLGLLGVPGFSPPAPPGTPMTFTPVPGIIMGSVAMPFWFIIMMFFAFWLFYYIADYAIQNEKRLFSVIGALILSSYLMNLVVDAQNVGLPWNLQNVPMCTAMLLIGTYLGQKGVLSPGFSTPKWNLINSLTGLILIVVLEANYAGIGAFSGGAFSYFGAVEVLPCVALGTLGTFMVVSLCRWLEKCVPVAFVLTWIGERTMPILLLHMVFAAYIREFTGIAYGYSAEVGESLLNYALTLVAMVVYLIVWPKLQGALKKNKAA